MTTARTHLWDVRIVGGPNDGLHMQVRDCPNGTTELDAGAVFFPEGLDSYVLDRETRTLTFDDERPTK